jgi:hypothetical protein
VPRGQYVPAFRLVKIRVRAWLMLSLLALIPAWRIASHVRRGAVATRGFDVAAPQDERSR